MSELKNLINQQREKVLSDLYTNFQSVAYLGKHYTLADSDYCDNNSRFPDAGTDGSGRTVEQLIPVHWNEKEKEKIRDQIISLDVLDKKEHWDTVTSEYMKSFQCGFHYLDSYSFKYYLSAFINLYIANPVSTNDFSQRFFNWFLNPHTVVNDWYSSLGFPQLKVVVDFLIYVVMLNSDDSFAAKQALEIEWLKHENYGKSMLGKYLEEKMIDDFIEK
ncbi:hypothetical protein D0C16_17195 [Cellvibrio sp. KY-GH-1]|uniref:DUF6714 family protein n=1 Tax=Cellvibrio sp. KY-GH-1 TaxID=2303332 RepID=UPI0012455174|nr:DUF6714 family protein [Cellvibrio sp. KY-GH-1]QEY17567.1 hypothetical protein D0C16_17195 [Cellvibrio sp. KY-GH-1]